MIKKIKNQRSSCKESSSKTNGEIPQIIGGSAPAPIKMKYFEA